MFRQTSTKQSRRVLLRRVAGFALVGFLGLLWTGQSWADRDKRRELGIPGVRGGVVTTSEPIAAHLGAEILRQGGNAIDAAAAIQFALPVAEPQSSGIGGGGFMVIYLADEKQTVIVDSREEAPEAATPNQFVSQPSFSIRSTSGYAVGVPGTVRGVATALDNWGTMSFAEVLEPAIDLAENGIRVSARLAESVLSSRLENELGDPAYDEARKIFRPELLDPTSKPLEAGDLLIQPDLANTYKLLAAGGPDTFYTGPIAEAIVATQKNTRAANPDGIGRMTLADLVQYEAKLREPVVARYRGYDIVGMGPPSSGALTVGYILGVLERFPLGDKSQGYGFGSTRTLNVMIEAMRLAFADRAVWMGDADFVDVPVRGLLNPSYLALRSSQIDPDSRLANVVADDPRPFDHALYDDLSRRMKLAMVELPDEEGINTTHFSIIDRHGNIVSYTSTIESSWGTGLMVPSYGFLLNNELTDFNRVPTANLNPADPADFNPGANDVAPGKRPRSSMSPTIVFDGKKPLVGLGSPGGSTIIDTVVDVIINLVDHRMPIVEAIEAPRIAQTSANGSTGIELGFDDNVLDELVALGHAFRDPSVPGIVGSAQGSVQAVLNDKAKRQYGAADERRLGATISVRRDEIAGFRKDDDDDKDD